MRMVRRWHVWKVPGHFRFTGGKLVWINEHFAHKKYDIPIPNNWMTEEPLEQQAQD